MDYRNHRYQQIDRCVFTLSSPSQTDPTTTTTTIVSDLKSIVVVYQARLARLADIIKTCPPLHSQVIMIMRGREGGRAI